MTVATAADSPTAASTDAVAEEWVRAFADGWRAPADADSFADHFDRLMADDVRLVQPQLPTSVGRQAFRELFARPAFGLIEDLHATVDGWAARDDTVTIEITLEGTLGGRPVSWRAVDVVTLRDGLAAERRSYFDPTPLLAAVATRPRAWPRFARLRAQQLGRRLGIGGGAR